MPTRRPIDGDPARRPRAITQADMTMRGTRAIRASIPACCIFAGTFLLRWVTLDFENDYFMHLAWASEMLRGQAPVRDFVEPGFILQTLVAFTGFQIGGYQLVWEGVFAAASIALGTTFVYLACRGAAIGRWPMLLAVLFAAACYPRLYAYPKALVYPAALWAMTIYFARPSRRSVLLLAVATAIAFLFRHDHGVWIACAVLTGIIVFHRLDSRGMVRAATAYGIAVLVLVSPWAAWVAASGQGAQYLGFLTDQSGGLVTNRIVPDRVFDIDTSRPLAALAPIGYPRIRIRWAAGAGPDVRRQREGEYGLRPLPAADEYELLDLSRDNVAALVRDPAVEDTSGIDRSTLRVPSGLFPWLWLRLQQYLPLVRVRLLPGIIRSSNAQAWVTWVTFVVPWIALAALLAKALVRLGGTRDSGLGIRDSGVGARDSGVGTRDSVSGIRDSGLGTRKWGFSMRWGHLPAATPPAVITAAAVLSVVTYQTVVRGSPDSRLGDVAGITAFLLAWTASRAWHLPRPARLVLGPAAVAILLLTVAAAASYGQIGRRLADAGIDGPTNLVRRATGVASVYGVRPLDLFAPPGTNGLAGLARWLHDCTAEDNRVSIIGFEPQVFVIAERGFAGGMAFYDLAWASSERDQRLAIDRWSRQSVPVVLAMASEWPAFAGDYPLLRRFIEERYEPGRRSTFGGGKELTVWTERSRASAGLDHATGLPCFRAR